MDASSRLIEQDEDGTPVTRAVPPSRLPYHERLRGRAARNPIGIGWRGWLDIIARLIDRIGIDHLGLITAGVTFYIFLALIPAMIATVTLYSIITDSITLDAHVAFLEGYLPAQAIEWLKGELGRIADFRREGLTTTFAISLGISLWSMNNAVVALFGAMNIAYGEIEKRSIVTLYLRCFAFTLVSLVLGIMMIGAIVVLPLVFGTGAGAGLDYGGRRVTAPALFLIVTLASAAIFRLGPSRRAARWRWIAVGSVAVAVGWLSVSTLLSWYLSNVANYAITYGSLGTIIALMFWLFISVYILLLGAELNAEIEHQTMEDTTVGPPKPIGRRGAYVADTVGKTFGRSS